MHRNVGSVSARALMGVLGAAAILAFVALGAPVAHAITNCSTDTTVDGEELAFLALLNGYRASAGLGQVAISPNLTRSASWLATDMAARSYFAHVDSFGRDP